MRTKDIEINIRTKTEGKGFEDVISQLKEVQKETKLTSAQLAGLGKNASVILGGRETGNLLIKAFQQSLGIARSISLVLGSGANEVISAFQKAFNIAASIVEMINTISSIISIFSFLGFAGGGYVPGSGRGDTVPAMLTPGEFVISKESVNRFGAGFFAMLNRSRGANMLNRYASGGMVRNVPGNITIQLNGTMDGQKFLANNLPGYNIRVAKGS
jgi:hypothetical protein